MLKFYNEDQKGYASLGLKLPLNGQSSLHPTRLFNVSYTTEEQATSNFINLLLTLPGERVMLPTFGVGIQTFLFEQWTDILNDLIINRINTQVATWMPNIIIHDLQLSQPTDETVDTESNHTMTITIMFSASQTGANRTVTIFTQDGTVRAEIQTPDITNVQASKLNIARGQYEQGQLRDTYSYLQ